MGSLEDKVKGRAQELKGKVTGDRSEETKGKGQQFKGKVKDMAHIGDKSGPTVDGDTVAPTR